MKYSGIGGQAVLEGVMMRNKDRYAVSVRKADRKIETKVTEFKSIGDKYPILKLPLLRGIVNFVESLYIGMSALSYSASFLEDETEVKQLSSKKEKFYTALTVTASIFLAIGLFMVLPYLLSLLFRKVIESELLLTVLEGVFRLIFLVLYMVGIALESSIKRLYMYHGAEHKAINCVEEGHSLTVSNVRKMTRRHKRCGTSFIIDVVILSIILFMFIRVENAVLRLVYRIILVPVIAAFAYEFLRIAGSSEHPLVKFLSIPGFWFQGLTTKEPDDEMIEVAIASVEAVFDWKAFQGKSKGKEEKSKKSEKMVAISKEKDEYSSDDDVELMEALDIFFQRTEPKMKEENFDEEKA